MTGLGGRSLKVLMATPRFPLDLGGVERHVYEVCKRLAAVGCEVRVLCTDCASQLVELYRDMLCGS